MRLEHQLDLTLKKTRNPLCPAETITDADYSDHQAVLANAPAQFECLLISLAQATTGIDLHMFTQKKELMSFKQDGAI